MDLSMFYAFVIVVFLLVLFFISYKPLRVEINDYMISVPNRKIYYKWNEIEKISIGEPPSTISKPRFPDFLITPGFDLNYRYVIKPKNGKTLMFNLSQVKTPHPTLNIESIHKLIGQKKRRVRNIS